MKMALMILGAIFAFVIVVGTISYFAAAHQGVAFDKSSRAYVDSAIPQIVSSWNAQELKNRASPELLSMMPSDKLLEAFAEFSGKLGRLTRYNGAQGGSVTAMSSAGKVVTAQYVVSLTFEGGPASLSIGLILRDEQWKIISFYIKSPALTNGVR